MGTAAKYRHTVTLEYDCCFAAHPVYTLNDRIDTAWVRQYHPETDSEYPDIGLLKQIQSDCLIAEGQILLLCFGTRQDLCV